MRPGAGWGIAALLVLAAAASNARGEQAIEAAKLSKLPKQMRAVPADYPARALAERIEADVTLLLDLDEQGRVTRVAVMKAATRSGYGFDEAAMVAANQFEFAPAEMNGKAIAVQVPYVYRFRLPARVSEAPPPAPDPARAPAGSPPAAAVDQGLAPKPAAAAPGIVNYSGRLLERGTRAPLAGQLVTVFFETPVGPQGFEATTDDNGRFTFFDLLPGEWRVLIEPPGYYPYRTTEAIRVGEATVVTYFVERASYNPFDVTVTGQRPSKEVTRIVLPRSVIEKIPGTAGDPLVAVVNLPGVARTPVAGGEIVIRGAAPEDTQIFVEGATVPQIYHFGGLRSVLPIGMLETIDFQPGNFSSYYGRATGGVIDVRVRKLNPERIGGYVDVSVLDAGLYLEAPITRKAAVAIAARRSYVDSLFAAAGQDESGVSLVAAPVYYDYQLVASYRPANAHDLRLFVFGSDDRLAILFGKPGALATESTSPRFDQHEGFYRSIAQYRYVPGGRFENDATVSAGRDTQQFSVGKVAFDIRTDTIHARDTARAQLIPRLTLVTGVDFLFQELSGLARLPTIPREGTPVGNVDLTNLIETRLNNKQAWTPGGFVELEAKPIKGLYLSAGLRIDYSSRISQTTIAPRFIARHQLIPQLTVKGGVGLYYEEPQFDETDPNFGNPKLKSERAVHVSAGVEWKPRPFITIDVTGFYKSLASLVSGTDAYTTDANGVTHPLRFGNGGAGRVIGLELLAKHDFTEKMIGWIAYTMSRSERRDIGETTFRLFDFDQTHILAAVASYQLPSNWQVGARFRLVSGNPKTPVLGSVYNSLADRYDPTYGAPNSAREPAFHQLDLRLDKRWIFDHWTATAYLDLQNVYNHANPEGIAYNFDFTKTSITQGLPVLTVFGFKAEL